MIPLIFLKIVFVLCAILHATLYYFLFSQKVIMRSATILPLLSAILLLTFCSLINLWKHYHFMEVLLFALVSIILTLQLLFALSLLPSTRVLRNINYVVVIIGLMFFLTSFADGFFLTHHIISNDWHLLAMDGYLSSLYLTFVISYSLLSISILLFYRYSLGTERMQVILIFCAVIALVVPTILPLYSITLQHISYYGHITISLIVSAFIYNIFYHHTSPLHRTASPHISVVLFLLFLLHLCSIYFIMIEMVTLSSPQLMLALMAIVICSFIILNIHTKQYITPRRSSQVYSQGLLDINTLAQKDAPLNDSLLMILHLLHKTLSAKNVYFTSAVHGFMCTNPAKVTLATAQKFLSADTLASISRQKTATYQTKSIFQNNSMLNQLHEKYGITIGMPIIIRNTTIGSIFIVPDDPSSAPSQSAIVFYKACSYQIGTALEKMRLMDHLITHQYMQTKTVETLCTSTQSAHRTNDATSHLLHKLQTPLTIVRGHIDLLQRHVDKTSEKITHGIDTVSNALRQEIQGTRCAPAPELINISDLLLERCDSFTTLRTQKGISLHSNVNPGMTMYGVMPEITELIDNILHNAVKYSNRNTTTDVSLAPSGTILTLSITTEGTSIASGDRESIFRYGFRTIAGKRKSSGTGIGLARCYDIVHAHGGTITATAPHPSKTRITVTLPEGSRV